MARWAEPMPTATHENILKIASLELPVAVLNDGRRVITSGAVLTALGRPWKGSYKRTELPNFVDAENLIPFISDDLRAVLKPIDYRGKNRRAARLICSRCINGLKLTHYLGPVDH
jgi:hypothetical protein